jgi:hypothetical protein
MLQVRQQRQDEQQLAVQQERELLASGDFEAVRQLKMRRPRNARLLPSARQAGAAGAGARAGAGAGAGAGGGTSAAAAQAHRSSSSPRAAAAPAPGSAGSRPAPALSSPRAHPSAPAASPPAAPGTPGEPGEPGGSPRGRARYNSQLYGASWYVPLRNWGWLQAAR